MKSLLGLPLRVTALTVLLLMVCGGLLLRGDSNAAAEAQIKKLAAQYRAAGLPEPVVENLVKMERERLFPEERAAAEAKRAEEGRKRARTFADPDDEEEPDGTSNKNSGAMSAASTGGEDFKKIPELNNVAVKSMPAPFTSQAALIGCLQAMSARADAALDPAQRKAAASYLGKGRETGYAGLAFWINHELDLGLYLMLKACLEQPNDLVLLNNFAACLSMSGLPQKAVPLFDYLNRKIPERPTVLNNLGQAWLGLGDKGNAIPLLEKAVAIDDQHPEARRTLATVAAQSGDTAKAAMHLEGALSGGFDVGVYNEWRRLAPGRDVAPLLRANFSKHYREVPITKRWHLPDVPTDIPSAQAKEAAIAQFFADLSATLDDVRSKMSETQDAAYQIQAMQFQRMQQQSTQLHSLSDVQNFNAQFGPLFHPLKAKAQIMLTAIRSSDYATSYDRRIEQAASARSEAIKAFFDSTRPLNQQIATLRKQIGTMEGGEGDEEVKIEAIEKKICALRLQIQDAEISSLASINTTYLKAVESIANQRVQEASFWTALYDLPNDTAPGLYRLYEQYLDELNRLKGFYPLPAPLRVICDGDPDPHKSANVTGRMQLWEDNHCPISLDVNLVVAHGRWNCREVSIGGKVAGIAVNWDRKLDPVTWEVVEHSISMAGGVKEFEEKLTDRLTGKIGVDGKVTIKLDADLMPTDLIVRGEAGAEMSGPYGGKASADLGSVEISVQSGFRGEGPVPQLVSAMFGN